MTKHKCEEENTCLYPPETNDGEICCKLARYSISRLSNSWIVWTYMYVH